MMGFRTDKQKVERPIKFNVLVLHQFLYYSLTVTIEISLSSNQKPKVRSSKNNKFETMTVVNRSTT